MFAYQIKKKIKNRLRSEKMNKKFLREYKNKLKKWSPSNYERDFKDFHFK